MGWRVATFTGAMKCVAIGLASGRSSIRALHLSSLVAARTGDCCRSSPDRARPQGQPPGRQNGWAHLPDRKWLDQAFRYPWLGGNPGAEHQRFGAAILAARRPLDRFRIRIARSEDFATEPSLRLSGKKAHRVLPIVRQLSETRHLGCAKRGAGVLEPITLLFVDQSAPCLLRALRKVAEQRN